MVRVFWDVREIIAGEGKMLTWYVGIFEKPNSITHIKSETFPAIKNDIIS